MFPGRTVKELNGLLSPPSHRTLFRLPTLFDGHVPASMSVFLGEVGHVKAVAPFDPDRPLLCRIALSKKESRKAPWYETKSYLSNGNE